MQLSTRAIETCEAIHNDSRTPLDDALRLMDNIRLLHEYRRALRRTAFTQATASTEYGNALSKLTTLNNTIKARVIQHNKTMGFVN